MCLQVPYGITLSDRDKVYVSEWDSQAIIEYNTVTGESKRLTVAYLAMGITHTVLSQDMPGKYTHTVLSQDMPGKYIVLSHIKTFSICPCIVDLLFCLEKYFLITAKATDR